MTAPPFAHAGHWLAQLAYLLPLVVLVVALVVGKARERRARQAANPPDERVGKTPSGRGSNR